MIGEKFRFNDTEYVRADITSYLQNSINDEEIIIAFREPNRVVAFNKNNIVSVNRITFADIKDGEEFNYRGNKYRKQVPTTNAYSISGVHYATFKDTDEVEKC